MHSNFYMPSIIMNLYETDIYELQKFMVDKKIEGEFTEDYRILYNFAIDCKYSDCIQGDLIRYLLPFYLKTIEQAVIYENKIAKDIYFEFNLVIFFNQKKFRYAIGEKNYQYIMKHYIKQTIKKIEKENSYIFNWVSLFNTTIAFGNNIQKLFQKIFEGSIKVKYKFFQYLSVLIFKESDNLIIMNETKAFWTSDIWDFDNGCSVDNFFWSDDVVRTFDKEINRERIENLFKEVKPLMYDILEPELVDLFREEMNKSFDTGVFLDRKKEFLKKINDKSGSYRYWDISF